MTFTNRRTAVRFISFIIAVIAVLSLLALRYKLQAGIAERKLSHNLSQNVTDLITYSGNIESGLTKIRYANTAPMLAVLAGDLRREAAFAKEALDALPVSYERVFNTNKLLSQVGDYCVSLSKKYSKGGRMTDAERTNLSRLLSYCEQMQDELAVIADELATGSLNYGILTKELTETPSKNNSRIEGFSEFEEGFSGYPSLIYDGPFSDHILRQKPRATVGTFTALVDEAAETAANALGVSAEELTVEDMEYSNMESFCFSTDSAYVIVTKQGGYLCSIVRGRTPQSAVLPAEKAVEMAHQHLTKLGFHDLKPSYYEIGGNVLTANFAAEQDGVTLYPDLIKVNMALDNGEMLSVDARGYLMNHTDRGRLLPSIPETEARKALSPLLRVKETDLCVIPTDGLKEVLCWEFLCESEETDDILVYINAETGLEEQLLLLLISENGELTI